MPVNNYFSQKVHSEQVLYEDIIIESIKMYGQDVYYMPRELVSRDLIFGEDDGSRFANAYMVEMYIENIEGFDGEGNLFSKFGLEIRDEATFIVAKRSWQRYVGDWETAVRPKEGDLIYLPLSNSFFEISFVEHEQPFYQLSNLPVFKLTTRLFEFNQEEFETGMGDIDDMMRDVTFQYQLTVSDLNATFKDNDKVQQTFSDGSTIVGEVMDVVSITTVPLQQTIKVGNITSDSNEYAEFNLGPISSNNGSTGNVTDVSDLQEIINDPQAENDTIEAAAAGFIDFSEQNPFGEPN